MQLFVKTDRTHTIEVSAHATVETLRTALFKDGDREGHYFVFGGQQLTENIPLKDLGVKDCSTIESHARLLGGGKKRKKKTYTKPKKPRHKRHHDKLRVLKMYRVDGQKVERLRKQCPTCGPGIFMAMHFDRVYCGKCTLTYLYEPDGDE